MKRRSKRLVNISRGVGRKRFNMTRSIRRNRLALNSGRLIIHAESHVALAQSRWFVHFRPASTAYDTLIRQGLPVWLYLYQPGALRAPVRPAPSAAYSGVMTGVNMTASNPLRGTEAEWNAAKYLIDERNGVFCLDSPTPHANNPTQAVIRIDRGEDPKALWLVNPPGAEVEMVPGESWRTPGGCALCAILFKRLRRTWTTCLPVLSSATVVVLRFRPRGIVFGPRRALRAIATSGIDGNRCERGARKRGSPPLHLQGAIPGIGSR